MADKLTYLGYTGSVEASFDDECLHGRVLLIDDLITYEGETIPELVAAFRAAVERYIDYCKRSGKPPCKAYSGVFQTRLPPELHKAAAQAAATRGIKLNEFVEQAIRSAVIQHEPAKVEHVHQVNMTLTGISRQETFVATAGAAAATWNQQHATVQ